MLNQFGKIIRKARIDTGETLSSMAKGLNKTVSFLSASETGSKKIPMKLVPQIRDYLISKGASSSDLEELEEQAVIANGQLNISELDYQHQQATVRFARSELTQEQMDKILAIIGREDDR